MCQTSRFNGWSSYSMQLQVREAKQLSARRFIYCPSCRLVKIRNQAGATCRCGYQHKGTA